MDNQDVQKAIAAVKANPSDYESPLPWRADDTFVFAADGTAAAHWVKHSRAAHIAAAVNAVPLLIAEVERLQAQLADSEAAAHVLVDKFAKVLVAVERMGHDSRCNAGADVDCRCGYVEARRALGLEVGNG